MKFYRSAATKYGSSVPAFNVEGLKIINYCHGLTNVFVCDDDEAFEAGLDVVRNDVSAKNLDLLLVRKFFDGHVHPIKIERRDGENKIVVMDSMGQPYDNFYFTSSLIKLQRHLEGNIYYASTEIQKDHHSCYTFTAKALSKMSKTPDLAQELEEYIVGETRNLSERRVIECKYPERFAILAQSKEEIRQYMQAAHFHEEIFKNEEGVGPTFEEKIYKPRTSGGVTTPYTDGGNPIPSLLDHFARKYAQKIDSVMGILDSAQLSEILDSQSSQHLTEERLLNIGAGYGSVSLAKSSMNPETSKRIAQAHTSSISGGEI